MLPVAAPSLDLAHHFIPPFSSQTSFYAFKKQTTHHTSQTEIEIAITTPVSSTKSKVKGGSPHEFRESTQIAPGDGLFDDMTTASCPPQLLAFLGTRMGKRTVRTTEADRFVSVRRDSEISTDSQRQVSPS
jgi:hypothetical protein